MKKIYSYTKEKYGKDLVTIWPLMLICIVIPTIVRLKVVPLPESSYALITDSKVNYDFFSYYKALWFLVLTVILVFNYLLNLYKKENLKSKKSKIYIPIIIYSIFVILSTVFSASKDVAILGFMDRYEGVFLLLAYMVSLFMSMNLVNNEKQVKLILLSIGASTILVSIVGVFQFAGHDIFASSFGKNLIIPSKYSYLKDSMNFSFGNRKMVYSTLYNPNYLGLFMAMVFPISSTILLLSKGRAIKIFSTIISILSFLLLLGSGSKTGFISIFLYLFLIIIFFKNKIFKSRPFFLKSFVILSVIVISLNFYNNNMILKRVQIIKDEFQNEFGGLQDIKLKNNTASILIDDYELKIISENDSFSFYNQDNEKLESSFVDNTISFHRSPYTLHTITLTQLEENGKATLF